MSDHLEEKLFYELKEAIRKADKAYKNKTNYYTWQFPIILVDYWAWEVRYFIDESKAREYIFNKCNEWDEYPPNGDQENLVLLKFVTEKRIKEIPKHYETAKFHKEIDGERIYICKSFVHCEPELTVNVYI